MSFASSPEEHARYDIDSIRQRLDPSLDSFVLGVDRAHQSAHRFGLVSTSFPYHTLSISILGSLAMGLLAAYWRNNRHDVVLLHCAQVPAWRRAGRH
jgi:hypothetical protein